VRHAWPDAAAPDGQPISTPAQPVRFRLSAVRRSQIQPSAAR
jgi:hypothetical protein